MDFRSKLKRTPEDNRKFTFRGSVKFKFGVHISVQAGFGAYSTPRQDLLEIKEYTAWEVAIWEKGWRGPWVSNRNRTTAHPLLKGHAWSQHWGDTDDVAGWVPTHEVQEMFTHFARNEYATKTREHRREAAVANWKKRAG